MKYQELYDEYAFLLQERIEHIKTLSMLREGYISIKTISKKKYAYLQYRVDGKLLSEYICEENLPLIQNELKERSRILERLRFIGERLSKLEKAAGILDGNLYRKLVTLRRCATVEALPFEEREKSLAFANAMTALEGIPASMETEKNLRRWACGDYSFQESYKNIIRTYKLAEV